MSAQLRIQKALVIALFVALLTTQVFALEGFDEVVNQGIIETASFSDYSDEDSAWKNCMENYNTNKKGCGDISAMSVGGYN